MWFAPLRRTIGSSILVTDILESAQLWSEVEERKGSKILETRKKASQVDERVIEERPSLRSYRWFILRSFVIRIGICKRLSQLSRDLSPLSVIQGLLRPQVSAPSY